MDGEFDWRLPPEMDKPRPQAPTERFVAARESLPPEKRFTCLMDWHREILWEKRAGGATRRVLDLIIAEEFASRNKKGRGRPSELTSADLKKVRVSVRLKAKILSDLENWGIISVDQPNGKNPIITLILDKPIPAEKCRG
jgi:hypothetical protein